MSSRLRASLVVALVAVALIAWFFFGRARPEATRNLATAPSSSDEVRGSSTTALAAPAPTVPAERIHSAESIRAAMEQYKSAAAYPPWSRPHDAGSKWLLEWNRALSPELPLGDDPSKGLSYVFDADKHHVMYGDAYTSFIEVRKKDASGVHRVLATISSAWVMVTSGPQQGRAVPLSYHDDGNDGDDAAGDFRYSNRFVPAEIDKLQKAQSVRIQAIVECEGEQRLVVRDFTYAPRQPLQILGVTDGAKAGSLAVTVAVEVFEKGLYTFDGNLMSGDGSRAIAWAEKSAPLDVGKTTVELTFFGKAIVDSGIAGPYQVRDLRGFERFLDNSEANVWFSYPTPYLTRAYAPSDLSGADWNDPEKQEKLARLQQLADDTASGRAGQPTGQPAHIHVGADGVARTVAPGDPWPPPETTAPRR